MPKNIYMLRDIGGGATYGLLSKGSSYFVDDALADELVNRGAARRSDPPLAVASSAPRRATWLRLGTYGDSTADTNNTTTDQSVQTLTFAAGGSVSGTSPEKFLVTSFYSQAYLVANGGIGGTTTASMLTREASAASPTRKALRDVLDLRPDALLLRAGGINDFAGLSAAQVAAQIPTTYANHIELINRSLMQGVPVIDRGIYGYSGNSYPAPDAVRAACVQLNQMYAAYAATLNGLVRFISPIGVVVDDSCNFFPNCVLADGQGVHLSMEGERLMAQLEASALVSMFGPSYGPRYPGINLLKSATTAANGGNPLFHSVSGGIPTGLNWGYASSANQSYAVETINGRKWASMTSVPNAAGNYIAPYFDLDGANCPLVANDVVGCEFDIIVQSANGGAPPPLSGWYSRLMLTKQGGNTININFHQESQTSTFNAAYFGKCFSQPFLMPADTTTFSQAQMMAQITSADAVTPWTVKVSEPRLVKLNPAVQLF